MVPEAITRIVLYFKEKNGSEPFREWLNSLLKKKRDVEWTKITTRIKRAGKGNLGDHRFLKGDFCELKIDYGPGYRVYLGIDENRYLLLLHGGTKQNQQQDIELAQRRWIQYQSNKTKEHKNEK